MIVAGIGCRRDCPAEDIVALVREAMRLAAGTVSMLASAAHRAEQPDMQRAAAELGLALLAIDTPALVREQRRCVTHSAVVQRHTGLGSVAEAAALAAAGPDSRLILPRIASHRATCALAESAT